MQYLGGKERQARYVVDRILEHKEGCTEYLEPFMGGGAIFSRVAPHFPGKATGSDTHPDLILMWRSALNGWTPPTEVSRDTYRELRGAQPSALRGFVGFGCSFGGKWFGGYASNSRGDDFCGAAGRGLGKKVKGMAGACVLQSDYRKFTPGAGVLVYCDPPYAGTTGYDGVGAFEHGEFWSTMREWANAGATVLVSEYNAPQWAIEVWARQAVKSLRKDSNDRPATEKMFLVPAEERDDMARKCGACREEGHTRVTCPTAGTEQVKCGQCGNAFSATEGSGAVFCSKTCFEYNRDGKTGSPWMPDPDPFESPTETPILDEAPHPEEPEPTGDHRKWCTRCRLIGHYAADCTTAVLEGGVVSVPEPSPYLALLAAEVGDPGTVADAVDALPYPGSPSSVTDVAQVEPDPFADPTPPKPGLNVSGQPKARYEWHGKQNRGYLVKLPETGDFRRYKNGSAKGIARATTFNKAATDSTGLTDWAKRNVLIGASKRPDLVAKAHGMTHEDNRGELMSLVAELEETAGAKVSADIGTLIHELTEQWDAGQITRRDVPVQYQGLILLYSETLKAAGLIPVAGLIERTTYIPEFGGVVGTLDRVYYHERSGQYLIGDVKTGKTLKYGMDEIETQEWVYAHGVNQSGVYDWNTDTWTLPGDHGGTRLVTVSEEWGVVVHMPVQGPDAGKVMLVRADLQRGKRHAEVCHDVRVQRANKPKPEAWTGEEFGVPLSWVDQAERVTSKAEAHDMWERAAAAGVSDAELASLATIMLRRLEPEPPF